MPDAKTSKKSNRSTIAIGRLDKRLIRSLLRLRYTVTYMLQGVITVLPIRLILRHTRDHRVALNIRGALRSFQRTTSCRVNTRIHRRYVIGMPIS